MLFFSLATLLVQGKQIAVDNFASGPWPLAAFVYVSVLILASSSVLIDARRRGRGSLDHYRDWWRSSERGHREAPANKALWLAAERPGQ